MYAFQMSESESPARGRARGAGGKQSAPLLLNIHGCRVSGFTVVCITVRLSVYKPTHVS